VILGLCVRPRQGVPRSVSSSLACPAGGCGRPEGVCGAGQTRADSAHGGMVCPPALSLLAPNSTPTRPAGHPGQVAWKVGLRACTAWPCLRNRHERARTRPHAHTTSVFFFPSLFSLSLPPSLQARTRWSKYWPLTNRMTRDDLPAPMSPRRTSLACRRPASVMVLERRGELLSVKRCAHARTLVLTIFLLAAGYQGAHTHTHTGSARKWVADAPQARRHPARWT